MSERAPVEVTDIEVVEDFSASARCDEGFLRLRRLRCRNKRLDGSHSKVYRVDVIDRPQVDAVAVAIWRRTGGEPAQVELLLRECLRPAAYFRKDLMLPVADTRRHLLTREIVAGLLEPADRGMEGVLSRAAAEVWEEAGIRVEPARIRPLGGAFFVAPGILSEQIFLTELEVAEGDVPPEAPPTDGTPLEEGARTTWMPLPELLEACARGEVADAKTELAARRLLDRLGSAQS